MNGYVLEQMEIGNNATYGRDNIWTDHNFPDLPTERGFNLVSLSRRKKIYQTYSVDQKIRFWGSGSRAKAEALLNQATGNIDLIPILIVIGDFNSGRKVAY